MKTLQKQTSLFIEDRSTSSQEASRASHIQLPVNAKAKKMNAIYGPKCLEQYEKFNRVTSWGKMLAASLVGTGEWYSKRCKLTWRLKGTRFGRIYFRLLVKTQTTTASGFGLLPTPLKNLGDFPFSPKTLELQKNGNGLRPSGAKIGSSLNWHPIALPHLRNGLIDPLLLNFMMGFPPDWTLKPFLEGQTMDTETQSIQK